jgi:hypothetical protein
MAYVSKEKKAELAPAIKAVLKKYGMKGTIAVRHHSSLVVTLRSGEIDFLKHLTEKSFANRWERAEEFAKSEYAKGRSALEIYEEGVLRNDVNTYWIEDHYEGVAKDFLLELKDAMEGPKFFNHDDSMTDYFHRAHYIDIKIGAYDRSYIHNGLKEAA